MTDGADSAAVTPDGRYIVVRGRLWRRSDPRLSEESRQGAVDELMSARRAVAAAKRHDDPDARRAARTRVQAAKEALGERGPVWWEDGGPDLTRHLARTTQYADWYALVDAVGNGDRLSDGRAGKADSGSARPDRETSATRASTAGRPRR